MTTESEKEGFFKETGFGNRVVESDQRLLNKDGSTNVLRKGLSIFQTASFYHALINMPWWKFNILVLLSYLAVNLIFASLYFILDISHLNGMIAQSASEKFMEAFFFSTQTLSTVGFGRLNPVGMIDSSIAAIESMIGLLGFAIATGLLYGRFSRPVVKLLYSENALIAPYKEMTGFMFRIANKRKNELAEVEAVVIMSKVEKENGKDVRKFSTLKLELDRISVLSMTWTIVHPIDESSPMYGMKPEDFEKKSVEWLVMIKCFEDTFSQTVHSRSSYRFHELIHGAKFIGITQPGPNGSAIVELDKINAFEKATI